MLYVWNKKGNSYGIVDTDDGICEYISNSKLRKLVADGIKIKGVFSDHIELCDPKVIHAQAKLLGLDIVPAVLEKTVDYKLISTFEGMELRSDKQSLLVSAEAVRNVYNKHLRIVNLINNRYFTKSSDENYIIDTYTVRTLEDFCIILPLALRYAQFGGESNEWVQSIVRLTGSQLCVKTNRGYYRFPLNGKRVVSIDEEIYLKLCAKPTSVCLYTY